MYFFVNGHAYKKLFFAQKGCLKTVSDCCKNGVQGEPAVARDDKFYIGVLCRVESGAFAQEVCRTGVLGGGNVFGGEDADGEFFSEWGKGAGELGESAAEARV